MTRRIDILIGLTVIALVAMVGCANKQPPEPATSGQASETSGNDTFEPSDQPATPKPVPTAQPGEIAWLEDLDQAKLLARQSGRSILLDFTGSDWCGWCKKLRDEVFSKREFLDFAGERLVLVEVDFPQNIPQSDELKRRNQALMREFEVRGYPTLILLDSSGEYLGRMGYVRGGPGPFLAKLETILR